MSEIEFDDVLDYFKSGKCEKEQLVTIKQAIDARLGVPEKPYYMTEDPTVIEVGDKEIELITRGRDQMEQLEAFRAWLQQEVSSKLSKLSGDDVDKWQKGNLALSDGIDLVIDLLEIDAIVHLGMVVIREDREFVEEHFDLGWIIDSLSIILNNQPGFVRLTQGFFGARA